VKHERTAYLECKWEKGMDSTTVYNKINVATDVCHVCGWRVMCVNCCSSTSTLFSDRVSQNVTSWCLTMGAKIYWMIRTIHNTLYVYYFISLAPPLKGASYTEWVTIICSYVFVRLPVYICSSHIYIYMYIYILMDRNEFEYQRCKRYACLSQLWIERKKGINCFVIATLFFQWFKEEIWAIKRYGLKWWL
jgi:hypothetical protein